MTASGQGRDTTDDFLVEDVVAPERPAVLEHETDPHRLAQRQKQVDFGKNTLGYQRYREAIPRSQRRRNKDPSTPDVHKACSKRAFDGQIKKWRRQLHEWDPPTQEAGAADDVALATGAVMSLEAAGPAGREEPAPGGDAVRASAQGGAACAWCAGSCTCAPVSHAPHALRRVPAGWPGHPRVKKRTGAAWEREAPPPSLRTQRDEQEAARPGEPGGVWRAARPPGDKARVVHRHQGAKRSRAG
ncbi:HBP1 [Auxenochlorella protothecoides x Auxenochlorella symbiontica]